MKNIFKKSFLLFASCLLAVSAVALNPGTYSLANAPATSGSKKFNTYQNIYYGRNGGGLGANNGVEVKSGGMFAFKIAAASTIKFKVRNSKAKSITDTWSVKSISDADLEGIIAQCASGGNASTYYTNNNSELSSITITQTGVATAYTNETSVLQPGCYGFYLSSHSADGDYVEEIVIASSGPSNDATLKSITYGGTAVDGFSPTKYDYAVDLPASTTTVPTVDATANDSKANVTITQATAIPGTATINVTAEDGTTKQKYTLTFDKESANPKVESATWTNIRGTAAIDQVSKTITGQVTNGSSLTLTPSFTGKNFNNGAWTPTGAQNFANGPINYTFTSNIDASTTTYAVTITEAPPMSSDATLKSLKYNNTSVPNFSPTTLTYNIELPSGTTTVPTVTAEANDSKATATVTRPSGIPGVAKVKVVAEDGTELIYTINFNVAVPSSDLTIHEPEIYEAKEIAGGYGGTLTVHNGREYEVYFVGRDGNSKAGLFTKNGAQIGTGTDEKSLKVEWLSASSTDGLDGSGREGSDEFSGATGKGNLKMKNGDEMLIHIKGFDQFTLWGKDNNTDQSKGKYFYVYIDDVEQPVQNLNSSDGGSIRRYDITTSEHIIKVTSKLDGVCKPYGFSLRIAQQPRTKWLKGNDTTQVVLQTTAPKPVYYFTKYNNIAGAETVLEWNGSPATGIELTKAAESELGDTLMLSGFANCPVGEYKYAVVAKYNGVETNRKEGKLKVASEIKALTDTIIVAYVGEEIDEIRFRYYALDASAVSVAWTTAAPAGINSNPGSNGTYIISGTPSAEGTHEFVVSVEGGNSIKGKIVIKPLDLGNDPIMYLHKNNLSYEKDGVYEYLTSAAGGSKNLITRKAKEEARAADQYAKYKWVIISEDVDADNPEALALARGEVNLPVLSLKAFTYAPGRLNWGEPNNGSLTENGQYITVQRNDHPIFTALNKKKGDKIQILSQIETRGLMPTAVEYDGSLCLATALTRDIDNYNGDGPEETFLHEIPAAERPNGKKYICMPIARASSQYLTTDGKNFIKAVINYLLGSQNTVSVPELRITSFKINDLVGTINETEGTIDITYDIKKYPNIDLKEVVPTVTLASIYTHVLPAQGEKVDFSNSSFSPVVFEVTDFINRRTYDVTVHSYNPQGIDELYNIGDWVTVYDIYGRKIATTNENIYSMDLPHGVYMIVLGDGNVLKIMK